MRLKEAASSFFGFNVVEKERDAMTRSAAVTTPNQGPGRRRWSAEERAELLLKHLLAHVGLVAFPFVAGAVVIDVALLLDLPDHRAAAMAARAQARKGEIGLHATVVAVE